MRRTTLLIAAVLGIAMPPPASAAVTTRVLHGLPSAMYSATQDCLGTHATQPLLLPASGPASPPLGTGSLAMPVPAGDLTAIWTYSSLDLASLDGWTGEVYPTSAGTEAAISTSSYYLQSSVAATSDKWNSIDYAGLTYEVYDSLSGTDLGSATIHEFLVAHPSETAGFLGFVATNCDGTSASTVYFDDYTISVAGNGTTYDFEPGQPLTLAGSGPSAITARQAAVLHAAVRSNGAVVRYVTVRLMARTPAGDQLAGSFQADSTGTVTAAVRPLVTSSYYWLFPGNAKYDPDESSVRTVNVRTKITITTTSSTLKSGRTLVVSGKVFPHHPGATVTIWRRTNTGRTRLGTATVGSTGTFLFAKVLRSRGTYRLFATIPALSGNAVGTSPRISVRVV